MNSALLREIVMVKREVVAIESTVVGNLEQERMLERLREVSTIHIVEKNSKYMESLQKCMTLFNSLMETLDSKQRTVLLDYEEEMALKAALVIELTLSGCAINNRDAFSV